MAKEQDRKTEATKPRESEAQRSKAPKSKLGQAQPDETMEGDGSPGLAISGGGGHA